ncbi:MAG: ribonuclease HII [Candidatus Cloacimonas sp. 4484_209]|nr:MAG: ribonuclease HII [Candidatus Cloacimonas sp. 4484_209]
MIEFEKELWNEGADFIAGIDEVGRGPLAGPVVSAAVILPKDYCNEKIIDSKKLTPGQREKLFSDIIKHAITFAFGCVDAQVIDRINILKATYESMYRAIDKLKIMPDYVLVDGFEIPGLPIPQTGIKKGDNLCFSIAAASIIAKVFRDRIMELYDIEFPIYKFSKNKGYGTRYHINILHKVGPCKIHRKSFNPVRSLQNNFLKNL